MKRKLTYILVLLILAAFIITSFTINTFAASNVTLVWKTTYQDIDGFGVSEAFHQSKNIELLGDTKRDEIYDYLFSTTKGAGFSIFRSILGDGGSWGNATDGPNKTMQPSENTWDWIESNDDQIPMIKAIQSKYGINNILYTVWSPPAWMKTNNSVIGGSLKTDKYAAYATYLAEHIKNYKSKFGIDITHIGLQNEPDLATSYSSCTWTAGQFKTFMANNLVPTFDKENITAKVVMSENSNFNESFAIDCLNDSTALKRTDIVGAHNYGDNYTTFPTTKAKGKAIWQTEVSNLNSLDTSIGDGLRWAKQIHDFMTITQGNAWCYWWGACYKTYNGEALIRMDMNNKTYTVDKRLYTIGQYSRFIRPTWKRFSATVNPVSNVYITAYQDNSTGDFAIVCINNSSTVQSVAYNLSDFNTSSITPYRTSSSENIAKLADISASNSFTYDLKGQSVTTFIGKNTGINDSSSPKTSEPIETTNIPQTTEISPTTTIPETTILPSSTPENKLTALYKTTSNWGVGGTAEVIITNNSSSIINGWNVKWTFSGEQKITNMWNGVYTQSGQSVSVKNAPYNGTIPSNGSVSFGFLYNGSESTPIDITAQ